MSTIKQKGATLVEIILAMIIIGIAVTSMLSAYRVTVITSADPMTRKQATLIAESMMEEVLSKAYAKPLGGFAGPYTVANRSQFDTVTDYNGFSMAGIYNINGTAIPELANYSVSLSTSVVVVDIMLVTVQVTGPHDTFSLNGYRTNYE